MNWKDEDFELVGRRLDGEAIDLTDAQRALAAEIAADAEKVGPALDVSIPPGTLHRVSARMRRSVAVGEPARKQWLRWAGAAAAAAVVVAVVLWSLSRPDRPHTPPGRPDVNGNQIVCPGEDEFDILFYEELADSWARPGLNNGWLTALVLMGGEEEIGELLLGEENGPETWLDENGWENSI